MLDLRTVNDIFFYAAGRDEQVIMLRQDAEDVWHEITSTELHDAVQQLTGVLTHWGIGKGDRVALLAENRWEWPLVDFSALAIGAVDVPLYPTQTAEQLAFMLRDSGARAAFVSTRKQYEKLASIRDLTHLEHIVMMDDDEVAGAEHLSALLQAEGMALPSDKLHELAHSMQPDDLATIIYTSGTTGEPKGVMLTHGNIASNVNYSTTLFGWDELRSCISFLPLSHITARHLDYALFCYGSRLAYCPQFDKLATVMRQVSPTIFVAVPRVYEKIREAVEQKASSGVKSSILQWALHVGHKHRAVTLRGEVPTSLSWKLANKLVYSKIREAFGGRAVDFISGGAPLGMDTAGWFADVGIRIFEGYGLTETSPVIALNNRMDYRIGSVGKPLPNLECRVAPDGELEVKGPSVFKGYWNKPTETAEAFTEDGWFKTGDIACIDDDGFLYITDRKKELLKTSGGKLIAPQPIENKLKAHLLVGQAAVVGDKHKFASVLISPNFAALEPWARERGIVFANRQELVGNAQVAAQYQTIVDNVNASLANYETIKRLHVVPEEWSLESGELTPSMKLKRRVINQQYAFEMQAFYADEAVAHK
ncbi:MAG: AMP-dependent synthetase/ligase [Acidobacteriaceae bacterium]